MFSARSLAATLAAGAAMLGATVAQAGLVIRNTPTRSVSCSAGVCTATAGAAVMNASDLTSMLASSDVTLVTGRTAKDVKVESTLSWASAHRLTLDAYRSILVEKPVTVSGPGALTLTTNDGGTGGTFSTQFPSRVDFWDLSSSLIINGANYLLVGDIAGMATQRTGAHVALAKNYDASANGIYTSSPVVGLDGVLEGLGHIISHLTIRTSKRGAEIGLFSWIADGGQIENIGLTKVDVLAAGYRSYVGALAGYNNGSIANAFARGRVHGGNQSYVGGLIGNNAINKGSTYDYIGTIVSSFTTGTVIGDEGAAVGGLVGTGDYGSYISNSHSAANVVATTAATVLGASAAGGLVGFLEGSVTNSWAAGTVAVGDGDSAGGLVGVYFNDLLTNSNLENCYATGNVAAGQSANSGGLIGELFHNNGETLVPTTNSYATGQPVGGMGSYTGGFAGAVVNGGSFGDTYWDTDSSGITNASQGAGNNPNEPGIAGLSNAQLTSGLPAGFDPTVWAENPSINGGRPYLIANPPSP